MPTFKTVTNPKTGKMETVEVPSDEAIKRKLAQEHKELRDMLDGNTQFHDDPYTQIPVPEVTELEDTDESGNIPFYGV